MGGLSVVLFLHLLFSLISTSNTVRDSINQTQSMRDGETIVSENEIFVLGFFSPGSSKNRYLGIWYNFSTDSVVWVANRQNPVLADSSGALKITSTGNLTVTQNQTSNSNKSSSSDSSVVVWSSNSTSSNPMRHPVVVKLLDSGNLVVTNGPDGALIWQSFNSPSDSMLPRMKMGFDLRSGLSWYITAWKSDDDPALGDFVAKMDTSGSHEIYVLKHNVKKYRIGPWNGHWFSGIPRMSTYKDFNFTYVDNQSTVYYMYETVTPGTFSRLVVYPNNSFSRTVWSTKAGPGWITYRNSDECDQYSRCGPNGVCDLQDPRLCRCYTGYRPRFNGSWSNRDFVQGCVRSEKLNCSGGEGFLLVGGVKIPDTSNSTISKTTTLDECRVRCLRNCSCVAYAPVYLSDNVPRGCIMWFSDLIDTKQFHQLGQDLYLRVPAYELPSRNSSGKNSKAVVIAIVVATIAGLVIIVLCGILILRKKKNNKKKKATERGEMVQVNAKPKWNDELPLLDLATISYATNDFSDENRIGQGGFGVVYKGRLSDGQEIAVKRASPTNSGYGTDAFMTEATLIAKLQHRNLVRLLGCCIERGERILIYDFMQNGSLDAFIFGERNVRAQLDWRKRVDIIMGVARGLMYLHHDSRLKVIHRDLKAANVLLDEAMTPKISDFGTARIFGGDQMEENTERVIGTYGYMSPEYAIDGIFSIKSDVFSFGVLLLEIISGRKNKMIYQGGQEHLNLLAMAWKLWEEGRSFELVDETISSTCSHFEVERYIHIALLLVQEFATDRPAMHSVILMLSSDTLHLPIPRRPGFWTERRTTIKDATSHSSTVQSSTSDHKKASSTSRCTNDVTFTEMDGM